MEPSAGACDPSESLPPLSAASAIQSAAWAQHIPTHSAHQPQHRLLLTVLPLRCYAPPLAPAAFNDPFIDAEYAAYMFKYDTVVRVQSGQGCKVARLLVGCNGFCS